MNVARPPGEGGNRWLRPELGWLLLFALIAGCTLEQRFDPDLEQVPAASGDTLAETDVDETGAPEGAPALTGLVPEDAVVTTLEVFREAVRVGDLSLALSLFHRDAIVVDELTRAAPEGATRGEVLMELRRRHSEGLRLEVEEVSLQDLDGSWVVSSRVSVFDAGESDDPKAERTVLRESALLVPSAEGWRIALFHRSQDPHFQNSGG